MLPRSTVFSLVVLVSAPALAAEFYIVQDIQKQSCVISQEVPKDDAHAIVGDGAYGDEATAASDMSKTLACNPRDASTGAPQSPTGLRKE
jgi:hypothetical protein